MVNSFYSELMQCIISSMNNDFEDNYDFYRFGPEKKIKLPIYKRYVFNWLKKKGISKVTPVRPILRKLEAINPFLHDLEAQYHLLEDRYSKELMVKLIAYKVLGYKKVKLPLNTPEYWKLIRKIDKEMSDHNDIINPGFMHFKLPRIDLSQLGYDLKMYFTAKSVYNDFVAKQYEYHCGNTSIKVMPGDTVIDAGGCWGDTALYFAHETGKDGKVYSFEFIPSNIEIFKKNLSLNKRHSDQINIVQNPLWETAGQTMYYIDNGPGSRVSFNKSEEYNSQVVTQTVDSFVNSNKIDKINFIKMDIEGAELNALKGSVETIKRHKPVLAISIYHNMNDFVGVSNWIKSLGLDYKFYMGHYTIYDEETVIFAKVSNS